MGMSYESERHIAAYITAENIDAANFLKGQRESWEAFKKATGTKELPLEDYSRLAFKFITQGKDPKDKQTLTYAQLSNPEETIRILNLLYDPYFDPKDHFPVKSFNAISGYAVPRSTFSNRHAMSMLEVLSMEEDDLRKMVRGFGEKSARLFIEITHPLRESLGEAGLLPKIVF